MELNDYTLVVDDSLNGFKDAFVDDQQKQIIVSPAIFTLLHDTDSRDTILEQLTGFKLNSGAVPSRSKPHLNTSTLGKWS